MKYEKVPRYSCFRCGHSWIGRAVRGKYRVPQKCANRRCGSPYWDRPRRADLQAARQSDPVQVQDSREVDEPRNTRIPDAIRQRMTSSSGAVGRIAMDRPEVHNAFNEHVIMQLRAAFEAAGADPNIRVIVLSGQGPSFSAGADLDWMRRMSEATEAENREDAERLAKMLRTVAECPKPVVARVQGNAFGGGAGLVACSDIAIAAEGTKFGFTEVRLGLAPATIAPHVIRKIGPGAALPLFLTGERFDASRAHALGLVHRVVPEDQLDAAVDEVVLALLAGSPKAHSAVKELTRRVAADQASAIDAYTSGIIAALRSGDEGREGVAAFLEKRKPNWTVE